MSTQPNPASRDVSKTPMTDDLERPAMCFDKDEKCVASRFVQQIERELAQAKRDGEKARQALERAIGILRDNGHYSTTLDELSAAQSDAGKKG